MNEMARITNPKIRADFPVFTKVDNRKARQIKLIPNVKNMANKMNQFVFKNITIWNIIPLNTVTNEAKKHKTVNEANHEI